MQYCEAAIAFNRFEPWNAWSNVGFIVAAFIALIFARRVGAASPTVYVLGGFAFAIGAGSFAWHATHRPWAEFADVIPILGFVLIFLFHALRMLGRTRTQSWCGCGVMLGSIVAIGLRWPTALNGSFAYVPVLIGLGVLAALNRIATVRRQLLGAVLAFAVSLSMRTLDPVVCSHFAHGSHWLWHLLNSVVIFIALRVASHGAPASILR
ncbi:MAG: ceramidase domain-containing protein [Burkholderiales bacterium]|nr:ceramidase domain-containing protein [Burkholderiales bacterium]